MRLAVLSDVHGNLPALEAVLADLERRERPDGIVVAGDHALGTPYPAETVDRLRALGATLIAGNRDIYVRRILTGQTQGWQTGEALGTVRWGYLELGQERSRFLSSLPEQAVLEPDGAAPIRVVHGSLQHPSGRILPAGNQAAMRMHRKVHVLPAPHKQTAGDALDRIDEPVLICGHTHLQWQQQLGARLALNPGSVGEPLDGDPRTRYAVLTWDGRRWQCELRALRYDVEAVRRAFRERGLLHEGGCFARAALRSVETGRPFSGHFVRLVEDLAHDSGLVAGQPIPDAIWQAAAAAFDWEDGAP